MAVGHNIVYNVRKESSLNLAGKTPVVTPIRFLKLWKGILRENCRKSSYYQS